MLLTLFVLVAGDTVVLQPGQRWGEARRRSKKGWMERRRCDAASGVAEAPPGVEPSNQHPLPPSSSTRTMPDTGWKSPVIILSTFNLWRKVCYRVIEILIFAYSWLFLYLLTRKFKDVISLRRDDTIVYGYDITLVKIDSVTWFAVYICIFLITYWGFLVNILNIYIRYGPIITVCWIHIIYSNSIQILFWFLYSMYVINFYFVFFMVFPMFQKFLL